MTHSEANLLQAVVAMAFQSTPALPLLDEMGSVCVAMLSGCCGAYPVTMAVTIITATVTQSVLPLLQVVKRFADLLTAAIFPGRLVS